MQFICPLYSYPPYLNSPTLKPKEESNHINKGCVPKLPKH